MAGVAKEKVKKSAGVKVKAKIVKTLLVSDD